MKHPKFLSVLVACVGFLDVFQNAGAQSTDSALGPGVPPFKVRPGYQVNLVAENIGEVRFLEFDDKGTLYVSQPRTGAIITLRERNGVWTKVGDFTTGKPTVHGMHFYNGWLWFTQSGVVWKARDTDGDGKADEEVKVTDDLPSNGIHWWRSILVTPSGFYTSIGDSGNITDEPTTERQKIWKFYLDGTGKTLFASGLRNTEKLRLRPGTDEIWGADHGSDGYGRLLGETNGNQPFTDHLPTEEFNHYVEGGFYGHPFIVGNGAPRLEFKDRPDFIDLANKTILPGWSLPAHWAPNGWNFVRGDALGLRGDAIIACHGSWNSTLRVGYRVERVMFDPWTGQAMGNQTLVSLIDDKYQVLGRPCDIAEAPDGSLFFSDDSRGHIYRISRASAVSSGETVQKLPKPTVQAPLVAAVAPNGDVAAGIDLAAQEFRPLDYFQEHCARCHGNYGMLYGAAFKGKLNDESLSKKVLEMTQGQAQAPLAENQRAAVVDFLRSLRDSRPYGSVVSWHNGGLLTGEALPNSKVWIESSSGNTEIPVKEHSWQVPLPISPESKKGRLHVQADGNEIVIPLADVKPK